MQNLLPGGAIPKANKKRLQLSIQFSQPHPPTRATLHDETRMLLKWNNLHICERELYKVMLMLSALAL